MTIYHAECNVFFQTKPFITDIVNQENKLDQTLVTLLNDKMKPEEKNWHIKCTIEEFLKKTDITDVGFRNMLKQLVGLQRHYLFFWKKRNL